MYFNYIYSSPCWKVCNRTPPHLFTASTGRYCLDMPCFNIRFPIPLTYSGDLFSTRLLCALGIHPSTSGLEFHKCLVQLASFMASSLCESKFCAVAAWFLCQCSAVYASGFHAWTSATGGRQNFPLLKFKTQFIADEYAVHACAWTTGHALVWYDTLDINHILRIMVLNFSSKNWTSSKILKIYKYFRFF